MAMGAGLWLAPLSLMISLQMRLLFAHCPISLILLPSGRQWT